MPDGPPASLIFGLPYVRPLHRRYALARIFSSGELDHLFLPDETDLLATGYAAPQFERAGSRESSWERKLSFLRPLLDGCERIPVLRELTGVSILKAYRKKPGARVTDDERCVSAGA